MRHTGKTRVEGSNPSLSAILVSAGMPYRKAQITADSFQREAETCRKQARQTSNPVARGVYQDLAKQFERKADDALAEASVQVERRSGSRRRR
jgi:hypothetical protein